VRSLLCATCGCVVAALDKTNDKAERRISARSVTDFHWTRTDPIHSESQIGPDPESVPRSVRSLTIL